MKRLLLLIPLAAILSSCVKEIDYDDRYDHIHRYFKASEILSLPNINYDSDGSPPDLRIDLKRRSAGFWEFSTFTENNAGMLPTFMVLPSEVLATDEMWELRLVDEDLNEAEDDEIFYWQFHALDDGRNGEVEFYGDGKLIMILEYNEK